MPEAYQSLGNPWDDGLFIIDIPAMLCRADRRIRDRLLDCLRNPRRILSHWKG